jgi:multimeric flavodoxin WrbA
MKILVLAGSPKGETSVTMQYVRYLEKRFKGDSFDVFHVVPQIRKLVNDIGFFDGLVGRMVDADLVLWSFPLYFFIVHSGYKRLIELLYERNARSRLQGKPAAVLTTSIHFHDSTAITYMRGVLEDLGMPYADCHTPGMRDLMDKNKRENLVRFFENLKLTVSGDDFLSPVNTPLPEKPAPFAAADLGGTIRTEGRIVVLTDTLEGNTGALVESFCSAFADKPPVYTLKDMGMKGPCLGCLKCGPANHCSYEGKDGYIGFFMDKLATVDMLVFAGELKDRYLSAEWKQFFDRSFFSTHHQKPLWGKRFAILLSGAYSRMPALQEFLTCYPEQWQGHLAGVVTDETGSNQQIAASLGALARTLVRSQETGYYRSASFAGIAGIRLFRDEVFDELRVVFKADHKIYRKHGIYDFPHRNPIKRMIMTMADLITRIPFIQKGMFGNMPANMIGEYKKILDGVE